MLRRCEAGALGRAFPAAASLAQIRAGRADRDELVRRAFDDGAAKRRDRTFGGDPGRRSRTAAAAVRHRARVTAAAPAGVRRTARRAGAGRAPARGFVLFQTSSCRPGDPHDTGDGDAGHHIPARCPRRAFTVLGEVERGFGVLGRLVESDRMTRVEGLAPDDRATF
jgi:hypothetical protein